MAFLSGILVQLIEWVVGKIGDFVLKWWKQKEESDAAHEENHKDTENLENAKTSEELKDAAAEVIDHAFKP